MADGSSSYTRCGMDDPPDVMARTVLQSPLTKCHVHHVNKSSSPWYLPPRDHVLNLVCRMRHGPSLRGLGMLPVKWQLATHPGAVCKARERVAPARRVNGVSSVTGRPARYRFDDVDGQLTTSNTLCSRFALNLYVETKRSFTGRVSELRSGRSATRPLRTTGSWQATAGCAEKDVGGEGTPTAGNPSLL